MDPQPPDEVADNAAEPYDILRYWLAMVRHEELLGSQIKVAVSAPRAAPDLRNPSAGQSYIKLLPRELRMPESEAGGFSAIGSNDEPLADGPGDRSHAVALTLLKQGEPLVFPVTGERIPFLEHLLQLEQRRARDAAFGRENVDIPTCSIGFPTFHAGRKRSLSTLLRFQVEMPSWRDAADRTWQPPDFRARKAQGALEAPTHMVVGIPMHEESDTVVLPYQLDTFQLSQTLGVLDDHIETLLETLAATPGLTPTAMVTAVTALLAAPDDVYPSDTIAATLAPTAAALPPHDLLAALVAAISARLDPRGDVRLYPFGLLWDGSVTLTTRGLQQDLTELLAAPQPSPNTPLGAWLLGAPPPPNPGIHVGLRSEIPLTSDQRTVADRAHAAVLTVASGPPGTGKTELILNLAAHTIIRRVVALARGHTKGLDEPMLVASTNNRAVDNVIDPLSHPTEPDRLPLALRIGSRLVLKETTVATLEKIRRWLTNRRETVAAATATWAESAPLLIADYEACTEQLRRLQSIPTQRARRPELESRRAELEAWLAAWPTEAWDADQQDRRQRSTLAAAVQGVAASLHAIAVETTPADTTALTRLWDNWQGAHITPITARLAAFGITIPPTSPPATHTPPRAAFSHLADSLTRAAAPLVAPTIAMPAGCDDRAAVLAALTETHAALADIDLPVAPTAEIAAAEAALFRFATEAREAWASMQRESLSAFVAEVIEILKESPHMLKVFLEDGAHATTFFSLFPVVGCTLLSIANTFLPARNTIELAVIDEAGQCHPAYAVSALARARRALIIGDVHQLEPVIGLDDREENRVLLRLSNLGYPDSYAARKALAPFRATATAGRSVQSIAARAAEPLVLHDHFRCQPEIIGISEGLCSYGLRIRTPPASLAHRTRHLPTPLILHDIRGLQSARGGSWHNGAEVDRVGQLVRALLRDGLTPAQIAILTPYRGQLSALRQRLRDERIPLDDEAVETDTAPSLFALEPVGGVALGTVHRFQGGERDVVIFTTVVTEPSQLPFLNDRVNLVNVAVSRARQHLVVVGHAEILARGPLTRRLIEAATWRVGS